MKCVVNACDSTETKSHQIKIGKLTYVTCVCDSCKSELSGEQVGIRFYRCGGLAFVEEIERPDSNSPD